MYIFSIPDIIRHMADVIVQAETEVFLATNYWEASSGAAMITDAMRLLSKRVGERNGKKIVFKLMYDRGNPKQVVDNHQVVPPDVYTGDAVKLPHPKDIPNIDLEVVNYHRPLVGTFHAKYMVVDRKIGIIQSNNIQDRVNVELMTHVEGPIVQSLYDVALISWGLAMNPPLPLLSEPMPVQKEFKFGKEHPAISSKDLEKARVQAGAFIKESHLPDFGGEQDGNTGSTVINEDKDVQKALEENFNTMALITKHLSECAHTNLQPNTTGDATYDPNAPPFRPHIIHSAHEPVPMVLVNRKPRGTPTPGPVDNPQGAAFLAGFKYAQKSVFIQSPTLNAAPVIPAILAACKRGIEVTLYLDIGFNDAGEMLPMQGGTNEQVVAKMYSELEDGHKKNLKVYWYTGKDQTRPMNASQKKRNCHVKIMIVDERVGIQGNGNQDTQSWFHSQEVNVMVDSPTIMKEWRDGLDANQNTLKYGRVQLDGIWRDADGNPLKDAGGTNKGGILGTLKGFKGAIDRVRGEGGF
ncbi:hypothetical protein DL93DRAFT_2059854 [Clavulina sp. PMI_390]|nr:hypothetical protein DL93DRAFT_2059854 [Clavulina sp. PMI_390]